jgi:hypothetical protein
VEFDIDKLDKAKLPEKHRKAQVGQLVSPALSAGKRRKPEPCVVSRSVPAKTLV